MSFWDDEKDKPEEKKEKVKKERRSDETSNKSGNTGLIVAIILIIICGALFYGAFMFFSTFDRTPHATGKPQSSAYDVAKGKYMNMYQIGQNFNITVGGHVYTETVIFSDDANESMQYMRMTYNGIDSNGVGHLTLENEWMGGTTSLLVSKGTVFLSGAGKFGVAYIDRSTITLDVLSWNPPSGDFK
jgi:hypothetical protein